MRRTKLQPCTLSPKTQDPGHALPELSSVQAGLCQDGVAQGRFIGPRHSDGTKLLHEFFCWRTVFQHDAGAKMGEEKGERRIFLLPSWGVVFECRGWTVVLHIAEVEGPGCQESKLTKFCSSLSS